MIEMCNVHQTENKYITKMQSKYIIKMIKL